MTRGHVLRLIRASGGLCKTYREDMGVTVFALLNGDLVPSGRAQELISLGLILPQQDGLFGDSQVYKVRE